MFNIAEHSIHMSGKEGNTNANMMASWSYRGEGNIVDASIWPDTHYSSQINFEIPGTSNEVGRDFCINRLKELSFEFLLWCQEQNL